jgi:orotidine-5'-phosphate decarboxylase
MAEHFADRLLEAARRKHSRLCVGLDPRLDLLPPDMRGGASDPVQRVEHFCQSICLATAPYAAAVKPQAAYFEALGATGMGCLERVMCFARELGLIVILDAKRNDIGSTAQAYADAYLGPRPEGQGACLQAADAITVNAYLGYDGVEPFVNKAHENGTGLFILVKTSNPGSGQLQDLRLDSGLTVYQHMSDLVAQWGQDLIGQSGYSSVGAVVGATYPEQLRELRARVPQTPFLVPGFGHQGATAEDVAAAFDPQGLGAIVNSARGIIYAYKKREGSFTEAAAEAAQEARDALNAACQGTSAEA